nr:hypothetical protein [Pandoravirus aubagnensis]
MHYSFRSSDISPKDCSSSPDHFERRSRNDADPQARRLEDDNNSTMAQRRRRARTNAFLHIAPRPRQLVPKERRQRRPRSNAFLHVSNKSACALQTAISSLIP